MENIKAKIQELFLNSPQGVNGISFGFKIKNNEITNNLSIIYNVDKKKPKEFLSKEELIPENILIEGESYLTDVVEISTAQILACLSFQNDPHPLVLDHRKKVRPLKGGISIANSAYCGYYDIGSGSNYIRPYKYGTLGAIVVDNLTNTLVGLTAGHIVAKDITYGHTRNFDLETYYNIYEPQQIGVYYEDNNGNPVLGDGLTDNKYNQVILQFNESGGAANINSNDVIGEPKRYIPAFPGNVSGNVADAGIFTLKPGAVAIPNSNQQLGLANTSGLLFANSAEIFTALTGQKSLYSAGRTTGPKGTSCPLVINNIFGLAAVGGYTINNQSNQNLRFQNILGIRYRNNTSFPAAEGDSGSVIYGEFSGVNKIVGLIFAGATMGDNNIAYACPISDISGLLNISPWTGDIKNFDNKAERKTILKEKIETGFYISDLGATYNQVGIISDYSPPEGDLEDNGGLNSNDMFIGALYGSQGLNSYEARFDGVVQNPDLAAVPGAKITYQIQITNTSETCCTDSSDCFDPNKTVLYSVTNTVNTTSDGSFNVSMRNNNEDALCFLFKILNVEKDGYNFRPDVSSSLETLQYASTIVVEDTSSPPGSPTNPGPVPGDESVPGRNGDEGSPDSSPPGGDEAPSPDGGGFQDLNGNTVNTGGGGNGGDDSDVPDRPDIPRSRIESCCEPILSPSALIWSDIEFDLSVFCVGESQKRITLVINVTVPKNILVCEGTSLGIYVTCPLLLGSRSYHIGTIRQTDRGLLQTFFTKDIIIPPKTFLKAKAFPSAFIGLEIKGNYNSTVISKCREKDLQNKYISVNYTHVPHFEKTIKWDNQINDIREIAGPHCYGVVQIGDQTCLPPCCNCCEEVMGDKKTWVDQCPPSLTNSPECADNEVITYINKPVWVTDCGIGTGGKSIRCSETSRIRDTNVSAPVRVSCEDGFKDCWPCRPKTCEECSTGVESLELLNIEPLGLQNLVESLDDKFKKQILNDLNV